MNTLKKYLIILITATVVALALAPKALAGASLTVDDDFADCPNADFNSIQAAVLAAEPGSAILVCGGTYREQVTIPSAGVTVKNNRLERNAMHGIAVVIANDNLVEENQTRDNLLSGIALLNGDANTVRVNKSERNGQDGIRADSLSTGNHIVHNFMRENLEHDAHDDSVGPGTAATANFWIKNNCETENRPGLCELPANHD